jgi:tartrate dehydratase alpha subunit/fumarate hydratase class I-like protein
MREIDVKTIKNTISRLCVRANKILPADLVNEIRAASEHETEPVACGVFG